MACTLKPAEIKRVKALGFLHNKGTDLFNGRIITRNGKITAQQAKVIARIGFDKVEEELLSREILNRKEQILHVE